jgi:glycosyltransferase involved in cell wall biosynthesis
VLADREHALLVPGGDAEALNAALAEMLGDGALRRRLGIAGRALIEERYAGSRVAEALERHYVRLAAA